MVLHYVPECAAPEAFYVVAIAIIHDGFHIKRNCVTEHSPAVTTYGQVTSEAACEHGYSPPATTASVGTSSTAGATGVPSSAGARSNHARASSVVMIPAASAAV